MIRTKLLYAVLLVILGFFWVLYRGTLSFQLLILGLLFPLIPFVMMLILRRSVKATLHHTKEPIHTGEQFEWVLSLHNRSMISAPGARVEMEYRTSLSGNVEKLRVQIPVLPRNTQRLLLRFHMVTCGIQTLKIRRLVIYDPLRMFRRRVMVNVEDRVLVLPAEDPMRAEEWELKKHLADDSDNFDQTKPGDDPSEVFDLHLYREGDSVSRIHWKLSMKLDQLLVKEYSLPIAGQLLLLPDYRTAGKPEESALRLDAMLGALHTAAVELCSSATPFSMLQLAPQDGFLYRETTGSADETELFFRDLLQAQPAEEDTEALLLEYLAELLSAPVMPDHMLFFTPLLSEAMIAELSALPDLSRVTVFAVLGEGESLPEDLPFLCFTLPVTPQPERTHHRPITVLTEAEMFYADEEGGGVPCS